MRHFLPTSWTSGSGSTVVKRASPSQKQHQQQQINGSNYEPTDTRELSATAIGGPNMGDEAVQMGHTPHQHSNADFAWGMSAIWITYLILGILNACGFLILLIYRCVIVAQGTSSILTVYLTTVFDIYNSDPINHPGQFYPAVWPVSNYLIDIPFIISFAVASLFCFIRVAMVKTLDREDVTTTPKVSFHEGGVTNDEAKDKTRIGKYTSQNRLHGNFYVRSLLDGQFVLRWLDWTLAGSALFWGILTLVPISEVFLLVTMIIVFFGVLLLAWVQEYMNVPSFRTISSMNPIEIVGTHVKVRRLPKNYMPFIAGTIANAWLWVVVFIYYGYSDNFNPAAYLWYRLAVPPIGAAFFLLFIPLAMLVWLMLPSRAYLISEWGVKSRDEVKNYNSLPPAERSYFSLSLELKQDIMYYAVYQEFTKNVIYEMAMGILGTVCLHTIVWIIWGGMLST